MAIFAQQKGVCRAGDILNAFLSVGDHNTQNGLTGITCPHGLSPLGFSASSMCVAITTLQVCTKSSEAQILDVNVNATHLRGFLDLVHLNP